jgi:FKBP-type peptidyl-prolyl cis-trans isomerase FklB
MKLHSIALLTASSLLFAACGSDKEADAEQTTAAVENITEMASKVMTPTETTTAMDPALASLDQKLSYIVGTNLGTQFKADQITLDLPAFTLAVEDVLAGMESRLSQEQIGETVTTMQEAAEARQLAAKLQISAENKALGAAYLLANGKKEGVITTESGLQYKEVVAGQGPMAMAESKVVVHYTGTLTDGTVFDSSYKRGEPAEFAVTGVIQGWIEAIQLMNVGDKFELAIPADLAYGPRGTGKVIGPDATLLFEVELLEIK